jgi:hypothetical protein
MNPRKKETDPSLTPTARGEYREMLKELARQQYIREKIGTEADFEKMWREAYLGIESLKPNDKK